MKKAILTISLILFVVAFVEAKGKTPKPTLVRITTTLGDITVKLYDETPMHKANFLMNIKNKTYEGLLFHRIIKDFMVQGGDPTSKNADSTKRLGSGDLGYQIDAEIDPAKLYHKKGALAAARTSDDVNPQKRSSASQFYIVTGKVYDNATLDKLEKRINQLPNIKEPFEYSEEQRKTYQTFGGTPHLDGSYTVFGEVIKGFDVLERIQNMPTNKYDRPTYNVVILKMKVVKK